MKLSFSDALTGVLVACALVATGVLVHREFFPATASAATRIPRTPVKNVAELAKSGHVMGTQGARVQFVEFSDFQCPYCRVLDVTLRELSRRHPNQIAVVYRHFPLPTHIQAMPAAIAAECAAVQGRFDPFAELLFAKQDSLGLISWDDLAARAGTPDLAAFKQCREQNPGKAAIGNDVAAGTRLGINGTPALIIGGQMVIGATPIDTLEAWFLAESKRVSSR